MKKIFICFLVFSYFSISSNAIASTSEFPFDVEVISETASLEGKDILLIVGIPSCGDCRKLKRYFEDSISFEDFDLNFIIIFVSPSRFLQEIDLIDKNKISTPAFVPLIMVFTSDWMLIKKSWEGESNLIDFSEEAYVLDFLNSPNEVVNQ